MKNKKSAEIHNCMVKELRPGRGPQLRSRDDPPGVIETVDVPWIGGNMEHRIDGILHLAEGADGNGARRIRVEIEIGVGAQMLGMDQPARPLAGLGADA